MEDNQKKRRLGKGLSELLGEVRAQAMAEPEEQEINEDFNIDEEFSEMAHVEQSSTPTSSPPPQIQEERRSYMMVPIEYIDPNPNQPRKEFDEEELKSLVESVKEFGIIQPIMVVKKEDNEHYFLVAGERRWRAAQLAGLQQVPVILKDYDDLQIMQVALIENIQRADLSILEEAMGYDVLLNKFELTQGEIAAKVGKSRSHIANMLRILTLPPIIKQALEKKIISFGHAKLLLSLEEKQILPIAQEVIQKQMSVRDLEKRIEQLKNQEENSKPAKQPLEKDEDTLALEADLAAALGIEVMIKPSNNQRSGSVTLSYDNLEQLDEICKRLCQSIDRLS